MKENNKFIIRGKKYTNSDFSDIGKQRETCRVWYSNNKDKKKAYVLKKLYGITIDNYNDMFSFQDGKCKGCNRHQSELKKSLYVDHCHLSGKIRGLLCHDCNTLLGLVGDKITILKNLINHITLE